MCRVICLQHEYLIFQIQQNRAVDHAKELDPVAFVIQPIRRAEAAKPQRSSESPRVAHPFSNGISKKYGTVTLNVCAISASEIGDDETRPRFTRDNRRPGDTVGPCRPTGHPAQPLAKYADLFAERQRHRAVRCEY